MQKTPDEIKKGLECCGKGLTWNETCGTGCPYQGKYITGCSMEISADALALIQQLEDHLREATKKVKQLEAERDAAVEDIKEAHDSYCGCVTCKNYRVNADCQEPPDTFCPNCSHDYCPCKGCSSNLENWQWRGVQKEE